MNRIKNFSSYTVINERQKIFVFVVYFPKWPEIYLVAYYKTATVA